MITIALLGLLASVSPSTIVVFILLLATTRARVNAAAFLIGWSISLIIVFAVSYAVGGARATQHGSGSTAVEVIEILLGAALAVAAARQWRHKAARPGRSTSCPGGLMLHRLELLERLPVQVSRTAEADQRSLLAAPVRRTPCVQAKTNGDDLNWLLVLARMARRTLG